MAAYELLQLPARLERELLFLPADPLSASCIVRRTRKTTPLLLIVSTVGSLCQQAFHFVVHVFRKRARDVVVIVKHLDGDQDAEDVFLLTPPVDVDLDVPDCVSPGYPSYMQC